MTRSSPACRFSSTWRLQQRVSDSTGSHLVRYDRGTGCVFQFNHTGPYYFICSRGYCWNDMKVIVLVEDPRPAQLPHAVVAPTPNAPAPRGVVSPPIPTSYGSAHLPRLVRLPGGAPLLGSSHLSTGGKHVDVKLSLFMVNESL